MDKKLHNKTKDTELYLANLFRARFPIIYIESWEEDRVIDMINRISNSLELIKTKRNLYVWSTTTGLVDFESFEALDDTQDAVDTIQAFNSLEENALLILKDLHEEINNPKVKRILRDSSNCIKNSDYFKNIILVSPKLELPLELQKDVTVVDFPLPNEEEIKELLDSMLQENLAEEYYLSEEDKTKIANTAKGLTLQEIENTFAKALIERKKITCEELDIIIEEKCQIIRKSDILELVDADMELDNILGIDNIKHWIQKRNNLWSEKASINYNISAPKGLLIVGANSCEQSMIPKGISNEWKLPLIKLEISRLYNNQSRNPDENIRKAIKLAESVSPCILWIDNIKNCFSEANGIFDPLINWMAQKTKPVFIVANTNTIDELPEEFIQNGTFDKIFWIESPDEEVRYEIFRRHLDKIFTESLSEDFEVYDEFICELVDMTDGFSGAEIKQVIDSALIETFAEDGTLQAEEFIETIEILLQNE